MKKCILVLIGCCALPAYANLSNEQLNAGICILASQGIHTAASERQAGTSKVQAKAKIDQDLTTLKQTFKNPRFIQGIQGIWYKGLDTVYQKPIYKTKSEKESFVSGITQDALASCMDNLSK